MTNASKVIELLRSASREAKRAECFAASAQFGHTAETLRRAIKAKREATRQRILNEAGATYEKAKALLVAGR